MSIVMIMKYDDVTTDQYDEVRTYVDWEGDVPTGAVLHVCAHDGHALRVTDVWDTAEDFQSFVDHRLMPGIQKAGITTEPNVEIYPLHAQFTPGV